MTRLFYSTIILLYTLAMRLVSPFSNKADKWYRGRKETKRRIAGMTPDSRQWLWFHAASLGEFEQGRPLIEALRQSKPQYSILITFYSPSGFEIRKNYEHANLILYLPVDTLSDTKDFLSHFNFKAVFFIKYEFWYNLLDNLRQKNIPFYFFSVRFRPGQYFFRWYGRWFLNHLRFAKHIFVQDQTSHSLLQKAGINNSSIAGDTRFDRVAQMVKQAEGIPEIVEFLGGKPLFVAGSTWPSDEKLLLPLISALPDQYKIIIAPHDIGSNHVANILKACQQTAVTFSALKSNLAARILVIDNIGMLSRIYSYASFVYIGGGFGKSIHNIQEPIAWGCPVIIGPNHQKFTEAIDLIALGGAFVVRNATQLEKKLQKLAFDRDFLTKASGICLDYVKQNLGATSQILSTLNF
jgi:3-deoxy-D-manno-octulosonic-acid transferase